MPNALLPKGRSVNPLEPNEHGHVWFEQSILSWAGDPRYPEPISTFAERFWNLCAAAEDDYLVRLDIAFPLAITAWRKWKAGQLS